MTCKAARSKRLKGPRIQSVASAYAQHLTNGALKRLGTQRSQFVYS